MASVRKLILASQSPRRAKILSSLGYEFDIVKTSAEEVSIPHEPERTVLENAVAKLEACRKAHDAADILASDTIVWFANRIYGKPKDLDEAKEFLRELSGQTHVVFTGVAYFSQGVLRKECVRSNVKFRELSEEKIEEYVTRVRPTDRAGAYDIDESGDLIVESYNGSYENIMGLPVEPVRTWLVNSRGA